MKKLILALIGIFVLSAQASSQVGYTPSAAYSQYRLDSTSAPFRSYLMVKSSNPCAFPTQSAPWLSAYLLRYGPCTFGSCVEPPGDPNGVQHFFKSWAGPGNEVRPVCADALRWWYATNHGMVWTDAQHYNGPQPTDCEITDIQATNDSSIYVPYLLAEVEGFSAAHRLIIHETNTACGIGQRPNGFWPMIQYYDNQQPCGVTPPPVTPPVVPPVTPPVVPPASIPDVMPADIRSTINAAPTWTFIGSGRTALLKKVARWAATHP